MATITDTLRTVLTVDGLSNYLSALRQAQQGNLQAALQVQQLRDNLSGLPKLLVQVGDMLGIQTGQWALIGAAIYLARNAINQIRQTVREAMGDFEKYNTALLRTSFLFNAMGSPIGVSRLQGFARERAGTTGIAEEETLSLLGRARQTGFGTQTAGRLVPLLQDVQTSGLTSATNALDIINRLLHQEGRGRGSLGAINEAATQLRLDPRFFTGGQQHDLQEIMRQLSARVGGLSERMGQTVSGTFSRNQELLNGTMKRLGAIIEASLVPFIEMLNRTMLGAIRTFDLAANRNSGFGAFIRGAEQATRHVDPILFPEIKLLHEILRGFTRLQDQGGEGTGGKLDTANKHLANIESSVQNMASTLFLSIFGSASTFTRGAASFRNFQSAVNARF